MSERARVHFYEAGHLCRYMFRVSEFISVQSQDDIFNTDGCFSFPQEQTKALDLSHFHADPTFVGEPVYACLNRSAVFRKVVSVISDHKVDLAALELSDNRLAVLDCLAELAGVTPNVTVLHLSNNSVR